MSHRDQRSTHFTNRHQIFQDDDSDENCPPSESSYFRVNKDVIIDIPSFPDEEKRTDNDSGIYNSSKATTSLCSNSDQEESEGEERAASFDYFPSATKVTPMYHNEYDEAYDVESDKASQNDIESPRSDKSGNKESDPDLNPGTEMETFLTYSRGQDDFETSKVKFATHRTLCNRRSLKCGNPMTHESTEEYGEMTSSTFSFDKSRKALKDNSASSLRRVDDHIHFPLSSPTPSRYSNFTRYDKSKSTGVHVEKSVYSRHHDDMFSGEKDPPFGHGKDQVDKVGKSICSLLTNSCSSVDDMPEGRPTAQSLDLADDGRRKKKKKKKKKKKRGSKAKINDTLKDWKDNDDTMYINTRAAQYVLKCIKDNSCVTITASSGVGKTATLRHVSLQMAKEGYDILIVTEPSDILRFYNPDVKTLFVVDDLCGNVSLDQSAIRCWELIMENIKENLAKKQTKFLAACQLQVYQDEKFDSLSVFKSCVCNMLSENICLSKNEKKSIAELYLKAEASEISDFYDIYDCFPLLCKMYHHNPEFNITDFFQNPFEIYESEIDKFLKKGQYAKYCALALCVMFNNKLREELLTEKVDKETRTIIENTCEACKLDRRTSGLILQNELDTLTHTFIRKEQNVYKIVHNKIFDFLAKIYGHTIIYCLIKNADSGLIKERFLLERKDNTDQFITIIPTQYHQIYIQRMIDDWSKGKLQDVFSNINMKIPQFRQKFFYYLNTLDISYQRKLAHTCDVDYKDTALIQCCFIADIPLIQWCISQGVDINQSRVDGLTPLFASKGHTEVVKLLLDNKATIFKCRDNWSEDERIPEEIRNMEQQSIEIYKRALKSGSEKKRDINLVIVGKKGAGKTSLVHRLFGEEFTNLESTNGIEIHRRQCKIKSNEWTRIGDEDKESDINIRIQKSVVNQLCMNDNNERKSDTLLGMSGIQKVGDLGQNVIISENDDDIDAINGRTKNSTREVDSTGQVLAEKSDQPTLLKRYTNLKTSDQTASKELSAIFKSEGDLKDDEDYTLTLWDFAGDEEFYATHQTFLNPDAVYLVVANLNDQDKEHVTFKFWMETIHCYGCRVDAQEVGPNTQVTMLNPPVIFVGTHTDELQNQDECSMQMRSHRDELCKNTRLHLRKCHKISNKTDIKDEFQKIKADIFDLATKSKTEKEYPVKFIQLERVLHAEYTSEKRILSLKAVKELASNISIPITDEDELKLFLRYQNEIGNLVFFSDIPKYIVLDPQWLADAFKCIITTTEFQDNLPFFDDWKEVNKTGKISFDLIKAIFNSQPAKIMEEHQDHLLDVMEMFDIIIKSSPVNSDEKSYYIPCMMQVQKIKTIDKLFKVEDDYKSTCLCFIFNFLPPYLISHLIVSCLRKFSVASVKDQEGLFKDCCVFDVSDCGTIKLLLVKFGNMIQIQVWQWDKDKPCQYTEIIKFIEGEIERIVTTRYRMTTVSFEIKWKCCLTNYTCENSFEDFGKRQDGEKFICKEHAKLHEYKDDWFCKTPKDSDILSDQQQNFARLSMVVLDILGSVLYDRLDLDKNIGQILHSRDQYDISSLYQEHYKLRKHTPSKGRWGGGRIADDVLPSHICIGDDIERIRLIRNEMQHSGTFTLDDARYHILITIIQDMLHRFDQRNNPAGDSYVNRLKEIRKMELKPKDLEEMIAHIQKEAATPHQNFADKIEYHYHF